MTTGDAAIDGRVTAMAHGALGLHLGLAFSGAGFDLMWQLPGALLALWLALLSVAAVLVFNGAQVVLSGLAAWFVWRGFRGGTDVMALAGRGVALASLVGLLNALPGLQLVVHQLQALTFPWYGLALALAMSWESWLAALGYAAVGLVAWARPSPRVIAPARNALAFTAPLLLCAAAMSAIFPLGVGGVALAVLLDGGDPAAPAAALGYALLRQGVAALACGVGLVSLAAVWVGSPRACLGAALLAALGAGLAFLVFLGVGAFPAALAVSPAVPAGIGALVLARRERAAAV